MSDATHSAYCHQWHPECAAARIIDPDCRDRKHAACAGPPCECPCHTENYWYAP